MQDLAETVPAPASSGSGHDARTRHCDRPNTFRVWATRLGGVDERELDAHRAKNSAPRLLGVVRVAAFLYASAVSFETFSFERFRPFLQPTRIPLGRRLTLLYGYNNAGKSALMRGLVLVGASCSPRHAQGGEPLALSHSSARRATFRELLSLQARESRLRVGLEWDDCTSVLFDLIEVATRGEAVSAAILERISVKGENALEAEWQPGAGADYRIGDIVEPLTFAGLLPSGEKLAPLRKRLEQFGSSIHWLSAARDPIERRSPPRPARQLDERGANVLDVLLTEGAASPVTLEVKRWFASALHVDFEVKADSGGVFADVAPLAAPHARVHLASVGEGIGQVLPVITSCALARHGRLGPEPIVAIEQPELHLHPAAELLLTDVLSAPGDHQARFIVETHSETLLLGVQLAVVEGRLSSDDVAVYWIESDNSGESRATPIKITATGAREDWPPGVFSEAVEQSRKILQARAAKEGR